MEPGLHTMTRNNNMEIKKFENEKKIRINKYKKDKNLLGLSKKFSEKSALNKYTYNFTVN